jgi:ABC-type bacteriocin/lantibiotic exporter with double-glycine peptidase domain
MNSAFLKNIFFLSSLFDNDHKKKFFFIFINSILIVLFETISVSLFIPFFDILFSQNANIDNSSIFITKYMFNFFSEYEFSNMVIFLSLCLMTIYFIKIFSTICLNYLNLSYSKDIQLYIDQLVTKIHFNKSYEKIQNLKKSEINRNILVEPVYILVYINALLSIISESLIIIILIYLIFISSPQGMASIFVVLSSGVMIFYVTYKKLIKWGGARLKASSTVMKSIIDPFANYAEVKVLKLEFFFLNLFKVSRAKVLRTNMNLSFVTSLNRYFLELCLVFSLLIFLISFAKSSNFDLYEILPSLTSIGVISLRILPSVNKLISNFQNINFASKSLSNFKDIINESKFDLKETDSVILDEFNSLELKNINFNYENLDKLILENLSFKMNNTEKVAIYGDSGSGKSTLGKIIAGLLNPKTGQILYNSEERTFFDCKWGSRLGYVPAESFLWEGNLLNNITLDFNNKELDEEKMNKILKICKIDGFLSQLENGLYTEIKDGGKNFSSGQVQRIALARHLYKNPEILILDESTNALDKQVQKEIFLELLEIKELTLLVISHDKDVISMFSKIYKFSEKNIKLL